MEHNVTSSMGLDLLDVADVVRQYPDIVEYLRNPNGRTFFDDLATLEGGEAVIRSIRWYLERYGMRCPGEIDMTRPAVQREPERTRPADPRRHQDL